jgi:glutamate carboxypeptidase
MSDALDPRRLLARLEGELPELLAVTGQIVALDTPSNAPATLQVAAAIADVLEPVGFAPEAGPDPSGLQVALRRRLGPGPRVLLLGHTDTVWPDGTAAGWPLERAGGMVGGAGVGDMKANIVMAAFAVRAFLDAGGDGRVHGHGIGEIRFLLVPDEELGSPDSRAWIEAAARESDVCLGLEPARPGGGVVTARGAVGAMVIRARGRSAHTTEPDPVSAVSALAPLVPALEALSRREAGTMVTVGIFRGGSARQVVPDHAELHLDLRARESAAADELLRGVHALVQQARVRSRCAIDVEGGWRRPPYAASRANGALYAIARRAGAAVGLDTHEVHEAGGSDVSFAGALAIPSLDGLGPITHDSCSRSERVEEASIARRGVVLASLLAAIGRGELA